MKRKPAVLGALAAVLLCAAVAAAPPAPPKPKTTPSGAPANGAPAQTPPLQSVLRFVPKVRRMSTYTLEGRYESTTKDVTFEAPAAYTNGFNFWAGRMKGQKRSEVCEMTTMTEDANDKGLVTFRRTIPKFDLEIQHQGQILASPPATSQSVAALVFEGTMDLYGNVKAVKKIAGTDDPEVQALAIPEIARLFPEVDGPHDFKIGDGFKEERSVRLQSKLGIAGLETVTYKLTRDYTLKSMQNGLATFEVKVTYTDDPGFKPEADKTTLHISGGGSGTALYEIGRGVFQESRLPTSMRIDIEAPLRPLPNAPETEKAGLGRSHIDLDLLLSGRQTVRRIWGDDQD